MLRKLFRKTPLAWNQVTREKTRLAIAIAGIGFADILMFVQLGFMEAFYKSAVLPHENMDADLVLVSPNLETLFVVKSFTRNRIYQAAAVEGVKSTSSLYVDTAYWRNPDTGINRPILVYGIDPAKPAFKLPEIKQQIPQIQILNRVLYDRAGRPEYGDIPQLFQQSSSLSAQLNDLNVQVAGLFTIGASFAADGNVIASDSTFLHLFPKRQPDQIDVGIIHIKQNADIKQVQANLQATLPKDVDVLTLAEFAEREKTYWGNSTPIGFVFGFGTIIGFIVGMVIVYQILYSDVSDHLPEYATLKAMGYSDGYLVGVLIQEAIVLGLLGFIPGFAVSAGLYYIAKTATLLPIVMNFNRAIMVLLLTLIMCGGSGFIAMRKLQAADPADVF
ncbi:MAG: ABC transporter permease DevC [Scytonema sp. PMC 1069.18]|nr:ABC transporter permease DevC [Scytonema sp. PMC 1069.18]MEC4881335.1 ABC transporter permease DevC [Scytonema sp. PMC 1070.18]